MYLLRSMLFTPGNNEHMMAKAPARGADAVILDLEDAVPMREKASARCLAGRHVARSSTEGVPTFVRVNALSTGMTLDDLREVVQPGLAGIMMPKAQSEADIVKVAAWMTRLENDRGMAPESMRLIPLLETAQGVLNAFEIAMASSRIVALAFGALDFTRDLGARLSIEGTEVLYARSHIVLVATAAGLQAIDSPWIRLGDIGGLTLEAQSVRQLGFAGKLVIHPEQVIPVNQAFSPTEAEVAEARRVLEAFREAEQRGLAAISLDGKMVDVANARQAADTVARAEAISAWKRE